MGQSGLLIGEEAEGGVGARLEVERHVRGRPGRQAVHDPLRLHLADQAGRRRRGLQPRPQFLDGRQELVLGGAGRHRVNFEQMGLLTDVGHLPDVLAGRDRLAEALERVFLQVDRHVGREARSFRLGALGDGERGRLRRGLAAVPSDPMAGGQLDDALAGLTLPGLGRAGEAGRVGPRRRRAGRRRRREPRQLVGGHAIRQAHQVEADVGVLDLVGDRNGVPTGREPRRLDPVSLVGDGDVQGRQAEVAKRAGRGVRRGLGEGDRGAGEERGREENKRQNPKGRFHREAPSILVCLGAS
jgi:hypothetical protein